MTRSQRLGDQPRAGHCAACGAPLAHDQRYCVSCGTRRGPLPPGVEAILHGLRQTKPVALPVAVAAAEPEAHSWLPTPRVASLCVMGMLSFGVIAGSLTQPGGVASLAKTLVVSVAPPPAAPSTPAAPVDNGGGGGGGGSAAANVTPQTITETITQPAASTPAASSPAPTGSGGGGGGGNAGGGSGSAQVSLPPIKHVFLIMLSDQGYTQSFGTPTGHPYLATKLRRQGELVTNYYGVAPSSLSTGIALLSGQGPTQDTAANCPVYTPITPTGSNGPHSQVSGNGCVYPQTTATLPGELTDNGNTWKAYVQSMDQKTGAPPGQPASCRHPAAGAPDANTTPQPNDPYVTWRNPVVYFAGLTSGTDCAQNDVDLSRLSTDLKQVSTTPNFAYIAPNLCDDGSDQPCAPGAPAGLAQADTFLKSVVPEIQASPAFKQDGLVVITFDQAPQSGPNADSSSCCDQPTYANLGGTWTPPAPAPSSPTTTASGTDTAPTTPPATTTTTSAATTTTPGQPCPPSTSTTGSGTTTSSSTTTTTSSTTGSCAATGSPLGGGEVGALLLSRYVKAGSSDPVDTFNHYSLLKTVADLFSVSPLGYSSDVSLPEFDSAIFNAYQG